MVDRLLARVDHASCPKDTPNEIKHAYMEFWESIESLRTNLLTPLDWGAAYTSTFLDVLTIEERLSFADLNENVVWLGSDATPETCAAIDHTRDLYCIFDYRGRADYLAGITGLPVGDFHLIDLAEYMSLICFLIAESGRYRGKLVIYAGDNTNVRTWVLNRAPKNRIARYLTRLLNRLEVEIGFTIFPLYISSRNNVMCDDLPRLLGGDAHEYARARGLKRVKIEHVVASYLEERMKALSLILPSDSSDRAKAIMQHVEKRVVRNIPRGAFLSKVMV